VAAVSRSGSAAGFSSYNLSVQVAAPGVNVPAQGRDGQYWLVSGTSPACALTAGVAALIKARYPSLAPALVVQAITASTQNRPPGGYDNKIGFGTVDAAAALTVAGKLAVQSRSQVGAATTLHFGGGAAAVPGVPIVPRGTAGLVVAGLFTAAFLAATALAGMRLVTTRRSLSRGHHAADRAPQPVWPGPGVHATWPDRPDTGLGAEQAVGSADQGASWPSWPDPSS
jgi:subtilisin family serine protease